MQGRPLQMSVPTFLTEQALELKDWSGVKSVMFPTTPTFSEQLKQVEAMILAHLQIPADAASSPLKYKTINQNQRLFATLSKWCAFYKNVDGQNFVSITPSDLGKGAYTLTLGISHIYIGPHRNGETHSLSLRVSSIIYQEDKPTDSLDDILSLFDEPSAPKAPKAKRPRKKKCAGENSAVLAAV